MPRNPINAAAAALIRHSSTGIAVQSVLFTTPARSPEEAKGSVYDRAMADYPGFAVASLAVMQLEPTHPELVRSLESLRSAEFGSAPPEDDAQWRAGFTAGIDAALDAVRDYNPQAAPEPQPTTSAQPAAADGMLKALQQAERALAAARNAAPSGELKVQLIAAEHVVVQALADAPSSDRRPWPEPVAGAPLGLYRVHWKSGGSSLAAIGMQSNGDRWLAPTNWLSPATDAGPTSWSAVKSLERLEVETDASAQGELESNLLAVMTVINNMRRAGQKDWADRVQDALES